MSFIKLVVALGVTGFALFLIDHYLLPIAHALPVERIFTSSWDRILQLLEFMAGLILLAGWILKKIKESAQDFATNEHTHGSHSRMRDILEFLALAGGSFLILVSLMAFAAFLAKLTRI